MKSLKGKRRESVKCRNDNSLLLIILLRPLIKNRWCFNDDYAILMFWQLWVSGCILNGCVKMWYIKHLLSFHDSVTESNQQNVFLKLPHKNYHWNTIKPQNSVPKEFDKDVNNGVLWPDFLVWLLHIQTKKTNFTQSYISENSNENSIVPG